MSGPNVERHYTGAQGRQYHETKRGIPEVAIPWIARLRSRKISPYIHNTDLVFEYGVGSGWNLAELNCRRRIGYDVSQFLDEKVRGQGIEFIKDSKWLETYSVDVAICHHTLEHVSNPPAVLQELRRVLCANGKLLLFVPYEKEAKYQHFDAEEPNHLLYSWNVQTLGNLVTEAGFKVVEARLGEFGYDRVAASWAERLRLGESGFRFLRRLMQLLKPMREVRIVATKVEAQETRPARQFVRPESPSQPRRERPSGGNRDPRSGRSTFRGRNRGGGGSSRSDRAHGPDSAR